MTLNRHTVTNRAAEPLRRRWWLVWTLLLAMAFQAQTAAVVRMLGPSHRHVTTSAAPLAGVFEGMTQALAGVRAWRAGLQTQLHAHVHPHAHAAATREHRHEGYERHHHHRDDTAATLDGGAEEFDAAAAAAAAVLGTAPPWAGPVVATERHRWTLHAPAAWSSAVLRLPERPPRG